MIKILQILPSLNCCGGVENYLMNYYRHIDKKEFSFDFAYHIPGEPNFVEEIRQMGGEVFKLPEFSLSTTNLIKKELNRILDENNYDAIHCHQANGAFLYFKIAKKHNIKVRILHSHQTEAADKFTHKVRNIPLLLLGRNRATHYIGCSKMAGDFLFGKKKYTVINNAVEFRKFSFNEEYRKEIREHYHINEDEFVIGNIGRLCNQKNQMFFIDIAEELLKSNSIKFKILIAGSGELEEKLKNAVKDKGIERYFIFAGPITNAFKMYNSFDVFVLPSLYEGLPVVGVEAQYNGLDVITSNNVTDELNFTGNVRYLSLKDPTDWANAIFDISKFKKRNILKEEDSSLYDISKQCLELEKEYKKVLGLL